MLVADFDVDNINLDIEIIELNRDIVLIFLICDTLSLDFSLVKKLYLNNNNYFWNFIYLFFPAFKIGVKKFEKLVTSATKIFSNLQGSSPEDLNQKEKLSLEYIKYFIKDNFCDYTSVYDTERLTTILEGASNIKVKLQNADNYVSVSRTFVLKNVDVIQNIKLQDRLLSKTSLFNSILEVKLDEFTDPKDAFKNTINLIKTRIRESE